MIQNSLQSQYSKCLDMMRNTIIKYSNDLWLDYSSYKSPAWTICYHALFYTNIYCSPTESDIMHWKNEKPEYHRFDKMQEMRKANIEVIPYTKDELLDFLNKIDEIVPQYLVKIEPEKKCWPYWYDENQLEFHINNLRHLQHHIGEMIERHDIVGKFEYRWE